MADTDGGSGVSLAELIAALSLTDLGLGQPMEHVLRECVLALGLAELLGLDEAERSVVYYVALLAWVSCDADSYDYPPCPALASSPATRMVLVRARA